MPIDTNLLEPIQSEKKGKGIDPSLLTPVDQENEDWMGQDAPETPRHIPPDVRPDQQIPLRPKADPVVAGAVNDALGGPSGPLTEGQQRALVRFGSERGVKVWGAVAQARYDRLKQARAGFGAPTPPLNIPPGSRATEPPMDTSKLDRSIADQSRVEQANKGFKGEGMFQEGGPISTEQQQKGLEFETKPFVPIPKVQSDNPRFRAFLIGVLGRPANDKEAALAAGLVNEAGGFAEFFESPIGIQTLSVGALGKVAQMILAGVFLGQTVEETGPAARHAGQMSVTGTPQEKAEAYIHLGAQVGLGALLAKGVSADAAARTRTRVGPATDQAVAETDGKTSTGVAAGVGAVPPSTNHGEGNINTPAASLTNKEVTHTLSAVEPSVGRVMEDDKILDPVVALIPVDVVNMLGGKDAASKMLLHDQSMLWDRLSAHLDRDVFIGTWNSLREGVAAERAKLSSPAYDRLANTDALTALNAVYNNLGEISRSRSFSRHEPTIQQTAVNEKEKNAIQIKKSDEGVLREERPELGLPQVRSRDQGAKEPAPAQDPSLPGSVDAPGMASGPQGPEPHQVAIRAKYDALNEERRELIDRFQRARAPNPVGGEKLPDIRQRLVDVLDKMNQMEGDFPFLKPTVGIRTKTFEAMSAPPAGGQGLAPEGQLQLRTVRNVDVEGEVKSFISIDQGEKYAGHISTSLSPDKKRLYINWLHRQEDATFQMRPIYKMLMEKFPEATKIEAERITGRHQGKVTYTRAQIEGVPDYLKQFAQSDFPHQRKQRFNTPESGMIINPFSNMGNDPRYAIERVDYGTLPNNEGYFHSFVIYDDKYKPQGGWVQTEPQGTPKQFQQKAQKYLAKVSVTINNEGANGHVNWVDWPAHLHNESFKNRVSAYLSREFPLVQTWDYYKVTASVIDWGEGSGKEVDYFREKENYITPSAPEKLSPPKKGWNDQSGALGVVPPGMAKAAEHLRDVLQNLKYFGSRVATRKGWNEIYDTTSQHNYFSALMDAADNKAAIYARQQGNSILPDSPKERPFRGVNLERAMDREAITAIIEANEDPAQLDAMLNKVRGAVGKNESASREAVDIILRAKNHWDRLKPYADKAVQILDAEHAHEVANGIDVDHNEAYVKHAYDSELFMRHGPRRGLTTAGKAAGGVGSSFRPERTFDTYADAIAGLQKDGTVGEGYKPLSWDVGKLVESRVRAGLRLVNRHEWIEALRGFTDPVDHRPVIRNMVRTPSGTMDVPEPGYIGVEILPFLKVAVHPVHVPILRALTGRSMLAESAVGNALMKVEGFIKHGVLGFDTFHIGRILRKQVFLTGKAGHNKGLSVLDYDDASLQKLVQQNEITQEIADYAKINRPIAKLGLDQGLNVGRIQETLYSGSMQGLPLLGKLNRWTFDKLTRGAMMESFIREFSRVKKNFPNDDDSVVARKVANDLNFYFGNLQRQGVFKNQLYRDMMRIAFLAPQWVESMAQTEIRAAIQLGKSVYDPTIQKTGRVGTLAKGVGTSIVAYIAATQLANLASRGTFTWDNPEKDHKLDAYIPDPTGSGPGVFISPLSVPAEVTHGLIRDFNNTPVGESSLRHTTRALIENKGSPLSRAAEIWFTGEAPMTHEKIETTWHTVKEMLWTLEPVPIGFQSASSLLGLHHGEYPGRAFRQTLGASGERPVLARSPESEIAVRAKEWNQKFGRKAVGEFLPYQEAPFHQIQMAVRAKDDSRMKKAIKSVMKSDSLTVDELAKKMDNWAKRPFTGSIKREDQFLATLDAHGLDLYDRALADRRETLGRFYIVLGDVLAERKK